MGETIQMSGLQFFGAMTASVSHEIKNRMAIINEQAGLLADYVQMSKNGRAFDAQRLERLAASVKNQISLTDRIIKNMNQFAHSVDHINKHVDLGELLDFVTVLFKRNADGSGLRLELHPPKVPVTVETSPFLLMNLIWLCLIPILSEKQSDQLLTFSCERCNNRSHLYLTLGGTVPQQELVLSKATLILAETLGATLALNTEKNMLKIELPAKPPIQIAV